MMGGVMESGVVLLAQYSAQYSIIPLPQYIVTSNVSPRDSL